MAPEEEEFQNDYDRGVDGERSVLLRAVNSASGSNLYRSTVTDDRDRDRQTNCTLGDDCSGSGGGINGKTLTGAGWRGLVKPSLSENSPHACRRQASACLRADESLKL